MPLKRSLFLFIFQKIFHLCITNYLKIFEYFDLFEYYSNIFYSTNNICYLIRTILPRRIIIYSDQNRYSFIHCLRIGNSKCHNWQKSTTKWEIKIIEIPVNCCINNCCKINIILLISSVTLNWTWFRLKEAYLRMKSIPVQLA